MDDFEIRLVTAPGLEALLAEEAKEAGFAVAGVEPGGVHVSGGWPEVWRANLMMRGAARVLARIGGFRAMHLAQLDKRARRFPWAEVFAPGLTVKVEATCKSSKIYHAGAARQRVERALAEEAGVVIAAEADMRLLVRLEDDFCAFSIDTSGAPLHQRGHKQAVGKAPMRETMASLFLRQARFDGREAVVDPMCGSGTFLIEAAEIARGLLPGRSRAFAFEKLVGFDAAALARMKGHAGEVDSAYHGYGSDRDAGAVRMAEANAQRAGVTAQVSFACQPVSELVPPDAAPGLVICNPPYGGRIGNKRQLFGLYGSFGKVLAERFVGWRVGIVTSEPALAKAMELGLQPAGPPVAHGGLKVCLYLGAVKG